MGDHRIGDAMGRAAEVWWSVRTAPTKAEALAALDTICGPYRGRDAEFESSDPANPTKLHPAYADYTDPCGPIGRLIAIAFDAQPNEMAIDDGDEAPWFDGPYSRFRKHYSFC